MAVTSPAGNTDWRESAERKPAGAADRVATLDAFRGLAAIVVVAMHGRELFWVGMMPYLRAYPYDFSPQSLLAYAFAPLISGAIGVSVLFVLSGYVIHRAQAKSMDVGPSNEAGKPFDVGSFFLRRLIRIYPTLLLALLITAICDGIARAYGGHPMILDHSGGTLLANVLSLQGIFAQPYGSNSPLWSLAIEVQFYLVYPLALMVRRRLGSDQMMLAVIVFSATSAAVLETQHVVAFPQYFFAWWLGAYMAERDLAGHVLPARWPWIAAACILTGSIAYQTHFFFVGLMLWAVGAAPIISWAATGNLPWLASSQALRGLGRFSYTLYAVHFPVLVMMSAVFMGTAKEPNILVAVVLTAASIVVCYAAFWLAEWPSVVVLQGMRKGQASGGSESAGFMQMSGARVMLDFERMIEVVQRRAGGLTGWAVRRWKAHQIDVALAGYPEFQPPFIEGAEAFTPEQARTNFAYFECQKKDRVAHLRFAMSKFGVEVVNAGTVDDFVSAWGAALMPDVSYGSALRTHEPIWARGYAGLNVVHDLAVFTGESAIAVDGRWRWAQGAGAGGCGAVLSDGVWQVDVVGEVGRVMGDGEARREGLARVRALLAAR